MLQQYRRTFSTLVLDEADVLLNDPFYRYTLDSLHLLERANAELQVVAAGATLPRNGKMTAGGILSHEFPQLYWCESAGRSAVPEHIRVEFVEHVDEDQKLGELKKLAARLKESNSIVFVRNAARAAQVATSLSGMGVKTQVLSQELDDAQRDQAVRRVMKGPALCTVCTDLVGRGLDTRAVSLVVQYDFATDVSAFLHRCGRTGRNGAPGEVVCFVSPENELLASRIQVPCERSCFTVEMRRAQRSERSVLPEASAAKEGEERRGVLCLFTKNRGCPKLRASLFLRHFDLAVIDRSNDIRRMLTVHSAAHRTRRDAQDERLTSKFPGLPSPFQPTCSRRNAHGGPSPP